MQLSNIRPNFTEMNESDRHDFFWKYAEAREEDFRKYSFVEVRVKGPKKEKNSTISRH